MEAKFYQIDAFTDRVFAGNPAGVCFLDEWLEDALLQSIAAESHLSETAFLRSRRPALSSALVHPQAGNRSMRARNAGQRFRRAGV